MPSAWGAACSGAFVGLETVARVGSTTTVGSAGALVVGSTADAVFTAAGAQAVSSILSEIKAVKRVKIIRFIFSPNFLNKIILRFLADCMIAW
jgi:hypothetical protein